MTDRHGEAPPDCKCVVRFFVHSLFAVLRGPVASHAVATFGPGVWHATEVEATSALKIGHVLVNRVCPLLRAIINTSCTMIKSCTVLLWSTRGYLLARQPGTQLLVAAMDPCLSCSTSLSKEDMSRGRISAKSRWAELPCSILYVNVLYMHTFQGASQLMHESILEITKIMWGCFMSSLSN